jgi:iron complex outermembrane recepter protein
MNKNKVMTRNKISVFYTFVVFLGCMLHLVGASAQSTSVAEQAGRGTASEGVRAMGISSGDRGRVDTEVVTLRDRNIGDDEENACTIKGKVTTADGQPAAWVTIQVKSLDQPAGEERNADRSKFEGHNTGRSTMTDEDGVFSFHNLRPGNYAIEISLTGYTTTTLSVRVEHHKETTISIPLQLSGKQLQEVIVTGDRAKYTRQKSDYIAKMPLKNMENPQVYTTITKGLLADQLVFSVDDAMRNATGVQKMWDATGRSGDGGSYYNSRGFIMQSQLRNGIAGNVTSRIDAANLERIEVIKGPSATLFGSTLTSYGGLINRVTKKPYSTFGGEVNYAGGNFGFNRISADINTPLDTAGNALLRINTAYLNQGSFQDNGYNKSFVLAPSFSYQINDRASFLFDAEIYSGRNLGTPIFFFPFGQTIASMGISRADKLPIDYKRSFFSDDLGQQSTNANFFAEMRYKLPGKWSTRTNVTMTNSYSDGPSPYFYLLSNAAVTGNAADIGSDYISRNDQFTSNSRDKMIEIQHPGVRPAADHGPGIVVAQKVDKSIQG